MPDARMLYKMSAGSRADSVVPLRTPKKARATIRNIFRYLNTAPYLSRTFRTTKNIFPTRPQTPDNRTATMDTRILMLIVCLTVAAAQPEQLHSARSRRRASGPDFSFPSFQDPFADMERQFRDFMNQLEQQHRAAIDLNNRIGDFPDTGSYSGVGGEPQTAYSSISLGPRGGFQTGYINPVMPGIQSRFGEDIPPPSGNSFGVFSSSSSSSQTGPDGKTISRKQSTTGVNDNGKISVRTVHD